jgi:pimeloyl-ACP methyl ester carboxylesterase
MSQFLHMYGGGATSPKKILVFVHGGGWTSGTIQEHQSGDVSYAEIGHAVASRGHTIALIDYPLCVVPLWVCAVVYGSLALFAWLLAVVLGWFVLSRMFWHIVSVPCYALSVWLIRTRMLSPNQQEGVLFTDQQRIVSQQIDKLRDRYPDAQMMLVGHSAGAHMVALYQVYRARSNRVKRVIALSGIDDLTALGDVPPPLGWLVRRVILDVAFAGLDDAALRRLSPLCYLGDTATTPLSPSLIAGTKDLSQTAKWVIASSRCDSPLLRRQASLLHKALLERNAHVETLVCGYGHGAGMVFSNETWDAVLGEFALL